jgi:hypothetical protein
MNLAISILLAYSAMNASPAPRAMTACERAEYKQMVACGDVEQCASYVQREVSICERSHH